MWWKKCPSTCLEWTLHLYLRFHSSSSSGFLSMPHSSTCYFIPAFNDSFLGALEQVQILSFPHNKVNTVPKSLPLQLLPTSSYSLPLPIPISILCFPRVIGCYLSKCILILCKWYLINYLSLLLTVIAEPCAFTPVPVVPWSHSLLLYCCVVPQGGHPPGGTPFALQRWTSKLLPVPHALSKPAVDTFAEGVLLDLCENFLETCTEEQNCWVRDDADCHFDSLPLECFPKHLLWSTSPLTHHQSSCNHTSCRWLASPSCLTYTDPIDAKRHLLIVLIGIFLTAHKYDHLFKLFLVLWISPL